VPIVTGPPEATYAVNTLTLNLVGPPQTPPRKRQPCRLTRARVAKRGAVEQMVRAFSAGNRLSAAVALQARGDHLALELS
jgi:hypothetical protein